MVNYIVNTLLSDFEPTDEKYEDFLKKAADKMDTSDDKFTEFLATLSHSKGGPRENQIHRSSTPNIQTTDEMVNMLQDAQSSILETKSSPNPNDRQQGQRNMKNPLSRPERPLNQRVISRTDTTASKSTKDSIPSNYIPSTEHPLQIPYDPKIESLARNRDTLSNSRLTQSANSKPAQHQKGARINISTASKVRSNILWAVTEAPPLYTTFMINSILIPIGVIMVVFLNFMVNLPNRITQVSQSMFWIYAELDPPEHTSLEAGTLKLLEEIFYLEERNSVIWRQWQIMGWPLIRTLGGGAIDRLLAQGVYWIFAEPRLVFYIQAGRRALWPDPNSSPPRPRGVEEMQKARKEAEKRVLRAIPAPLRDTFFGDNGIHHLVAAQEALEPLQNKICNKHLIYIALDLLLSKVIPEIYPEK
ncbi:sorting nexin 25 [Entomortierella beljakovae]|nr:sorting nexin 25 [Entomortierella beljakovae]